jgi:glycosyltransferase involved in cell wall biosynthesis
MEKAKILFLTDGLVCGGKERQLTEWLGGLASSGIMQARDLAVLSMCEHGQFEPMIAEVGVRIFKLIRKWRWDPLLALRLRSLLKELEPELLYSFNEMATFYAAVARRGLRAKLVDGSIRNAFPFNTLKEKLLAWHNFRAADMIVANSRAGLEAKRAPCAKSRIIYNGFDSARLERLMPPDRMRKSLGVETKHAVGMVAGFSWKKDWTTFLEAARLMGETRKDVTFIAVGDGELLEKFQRRYLGQKGIVFTGLRKDAEAVIKALDVGVLCSTLAEGFPNAVLEYMAAGLPVVATAGGGISELVIEGQTGFIVSRQNPQAVAEKIGYFLEHPEAARRMGEQGRARVGQEFSLDKSVREFAALYRELVRSSKVLPQEAQVDRVSNIEIES